MPVLVLCSIVDRNPVASDDIRRRLNRFVDRVRISLEHDDIRRAYLQTLRDEGLTEDHYFELESWVNKIAKQSREFPHTFFTRFAGQGRVRWHYGAAHPILSDIEDCYVAERGRSWLEDEGEARTALVLGPVASAGLRWFDFRELWQISASVVTVTGTVFGAFVLSYFTVLLSVQSRRWSLRADRVITISAYRRFGLSEWRLPDLLACVSTLR